MASKGIPTPRQSAQGGLRWVPAAPSPTPSVPVSSVGHVAEEIILTVSVPMEGGGLHESDDVADDVAISEDSSSSLFLSNLGVLFSASLPEYFFLPLSSLSPNFLAYPLFIILASTVTIGQFGCQCGMWR